jgi:hypothetical protein
MTRRNEGDKSGERERGDSRTKEKRIRAWVWHRAGGEREEHRRPRPQ